MSESLWTRWALLLSWIREGHVTFTTSAKILCHFTSPRCVEWLTGVRPHSWSSIKRKCCYLPSQLEEASLYRRVQTSYYRAQYDQVNSTSSRYRSITEFNDLESDKMSRIQLTELTRLESQSDLMRIGTHVSRDSSTMLRISRELVCITPLTDWIVEKYCRKKMQKKNSRIVLRKASRYFYWCRCIRSIEPGTFFLPSQSLVILQGNLTWSFSTEPRRLFRCFEISE